ncbi:hypothetical protein [Ruegeria lacuscaerulensis]|uniref:hypothetical protein n=1 Tax=Ruegeria lacuscaerulensis TaxID=55218 RepID=UPI00147CF616
MGDGNAMDAVLEQADVDLILPEIGLPGRDEIFDRVVGLEFGTDDYITKPFEACEVLPRIPTVLRRAHSEEKATNDAGAPFDPARRLGAECERTYPYRIRCERADPSDDPGIRCFADLRDQSSHGLFP